MRYGWRASIYTPRALSPSSTASYPRKYKEEKLAKDGGEKAATTHTHTRREKQKQKENKKKNINGTTAVLHWEPSANYVTRFDGQPAHTRARASASFRWAREDEDERERASQPRCSRIWQLQWGESQSRSPSVICKIHLLCLRTRAQNRNRTKTESAAQQWQSVERGERVRRQANLQSRLGVSLVQC